MSSRKKEKGEKEKKETRKGRKKKRKEKERNLYDPFTNGGRLYIDFR